MLGHLICSEENQKKILESNILRILDSEGVTKIAALSKISPSRVVLFFGSKTAKKKLQGTEIQCRFGDSEIKLSFRKQIEPLINGKEAIFVTVNLPQYISHQAVRIVFSHYGKVVSVCLSVVSDINLIRKSEIARDILSPSLREEIQ